MPEDTSSRMSLRILESLNLWSHICIVIESCVVHSFWFLDLDLTLTLSTSKGSKQHTNDCEEKEEEEDLGIFEKCFSCISNLWRSNDESEETTTAMDLGIDESVANRKLSKISDVVGRVTEVEKENVQCRYVQFTYHGFKCQVCDFSFPQKELNFGD